jgi:hypothetical protein
VRYDINIVYLICQVKFTAYNVSRET